MTKDQRAPDLSRFPRVRIGELPTPVDEMKNLRSQIQSLPRIFVKRDDLTGFGFGGNKVRKLEYVFGSLLAKGIDTVITSGGDRSNHARLTAFVCAKFGLRSILILDKKPRTAALDNREAASNFLEGLVGAEVHFARSIAERETIVREIAESEAKRGSRVEVLPVGGALPVGALGFVNAMEELVRTGINFERLYFSSSTAATHAGILAGAKIHGLEELRIIGITPEPGIAAELTDKIAGLLESLGSMLGIDFSDQTERIEVSDDYAGDGYCIETFEAREAIGLVGRSEAILLDGVYTGKAFAAMLDAIPDGTADQNFLFWHTGGGIAEFYR